ncbi:beta-N-acetylhexosaminidase [Segatella maculosa]|uniref:beta-N-acetylhexosaminidase n=1 Tax=Segatella maculosa OT 289 TaxID=999422 RepID=H1HQR6_9BACT|nr:beta-N-acetylhexosaminidase [Segatella maculosa]EHO65939.1 hypothetical protein HMPREF9944_02510 [Segatella maculosa OT 289]
MRNLLLSTLLWLSVLTVTAQNGVWLSVPRPQKINLLKGNPFVIDQTTTIRVAANDSNMERNARFLLQDISQLTGLRLKTCAAMKLRQIVLSIDKNIGHPEGYTIMADSRCLTIAGSTPEAVFHGVQRLVKALPVKTGIKSVSLPAVSIDDYPRFAYRGFLLDVGRHFFTVDDVKRIIDILALHQVNYLHWHLTEDQGWRIEIKKYPLLTQIGARRDSTLSIPYTQIYDHEPVTGYYTQQEAHDIVKYAADRYITVIPEIDLPGHMLAALASYPELGCTGGPYSVPARFGVFEDVLCGGNPRALQFAKDVLTEVMDIFPSPYIHIGGDECPKTRWKDCPKCQARIKELGLTDNPGHTKENQLQTAFMADVEQVIKERGRKMMGWEEILDGTPEKTNIVMAWTGYMSALRSAQEGFPTIICPMQNFYFSNRGYNLLKGRDGIQRVYDVEPVAPALKPDKQRNIIGVEACVWTEWVKDMATVEWQMLPKIAAVSEVGWSDKYNKDFDAFMRRLSRLRPLYDLRQYRYRTDYFEP